jgi:DNA polymerase V
MKKNIYALIDCDNFYVSCERIFRPDLIGKPVAVLSNNDGCIIARSNEVKKLGISMGTPYFKILDLIEEHGIEVLSSNYSLYADISDRVVRTLEMFSPNVEVYSIDEAFIQLSLPSDRYLEYAKEIRGTILRDIGVPTTVGVAYTKTLTKVAVKVAKKDTKYEGALSLLDVRDNDKYLDMVEIGDVWGVGRQYSKLLTSMNILTAKDLKYMDRKVVRKLMTVGGLRTVLELNNIECISLEESPCSKKSIASAKAFGKLTDSLDEVKQALAIDVARAAEKLRKQNSVTSMLSVFLTTDPFKPNRYSKAIGIPLPYPASDTPTLVKYSLIGLEHIFKKGLLYKKTGVLLTDISSSKDIQLNLFINDYSKYVSKRNEASKVIDKLNRKWGRDTVRVGSMGIYNKLHMRQERKSPRYTTNWNELLKVNIQ